MAVRTFEVLSPRGWTVKVPHKLVPGDVIRVKDDGTPQNLAASMLNGDTGLYTVTKVQKVVAVAVGTASGVDELAISFTG